MNHDENTSRLVEALNDFNAKERNFLMRHVLLGEIDACPESRTNFDQQSDQWVHSSFRAALLKVLDMDPSLQCLYAAMDYHLDWLNAALWCVQRGETVSDAAKRKPADERRTLQTREFFDISGTQEDIDLLLVFRTQSKPLVVMVEAKGVSAFTESQLKSKIARLSLILAPTDDEKPIPVDFAFVVMGGSDERSNQGAKLAKEIISCYGKDVGLGSKLPVHPMWMKNFPSKCFQVTRCDPSGKNPKTGSANDLSHWRIKRRAQERALANASVNRPKKPETD